MQVEVPRYRHMLGHHAMVEGMEEGIAPGHCPIGPCIAADSPQPVLLPGQSLAPGLCRHHVSLQPCRDCRSRKLHPRHTRHFQYLLCFLTQLRELLGQHLPNALREHSVNRIEWPMQYPLSCFGGQDTLGHHILDRPGHEQGMALCPLVNGVRLRLPIGWRADRGERERVMGSYDRAREALRARQLALESEVRAAHREADIASRELDAAGTLVQSAEEQARIARLEYQAGRGTAYDLVNLEGDLAAARQRETEVKVRIAHATTELRRLTLAAPGGTKR